MDRNPYSPPGTAPSGAPPPPEAPDDHPHYPLVLKMVLWGEERDEVYRTMRVNGITGEVADALYGHAWTERLRTLRGGSVARFWSGIGLMLAAAVVFSICWFGLGFIPRLLLYACLGALGIGAWKAIDGAAGYLMAGSSTGSVADDS